MPVLEETNQSIWDELMKMKMVRTDVLLPEERTIQMLMQEYDLTEDQVRRRLKFLGYENRVTKRRVTLDGKSMVAYTLIDGLT